MALPPTELSDLLYLAASDEVYDKLCMAGFLNATGEANATAIQHLGNEAREEVAKSDLPGLNHADILADLLLDSGYLNEEGIRAYHTSLF